MSSPTVLVVGGGIIGCSIAFELCRVGARVTVVERSNPGAEASSAAAGLLAPLGESPTPGPFQRLAVESWRRFPAVVDELQTITGIDVEHITRGSLYPLRTPDRIAHAREREAWPVAREFGVRVVEGQELRDMEPALAPHIRAALFVAGDHWIHNESLVSAYAAAAASRGVTIRSGVEVTRLVVEGGRAVGVIAGGARLEAERVVLAAGAWSGGLAAGMGARLPVGPVRGQMLAVDHSPPLLMRVVHDEDVYLVPRRSGELLVGATVEHVGFERLVTPEALERLVAAAVTVVPDLGGRPMLRAWCGFRPWAADSQPVLGPWPDVSGLYVATGHFRNGILLAPVTGALMAQAILHGTIPELMRPFLPDRFLQEGAPR